MDYEIILAEEEQTPTHVRQLIIAKPIDAGYSFKMSEFFRGIWLVIKWSLIILFIGLGISYLLGAVL